LSVVGSNPPASVTINELTTVASAFTAAQFIHGDAISGNPLGLKIAAGNVPNLVDPQTGGWGKVILDPLNSTQTTTLATLDTLGSLITASFTVANDDWRARFFKAATPIGGATPTNSFVEKSRSTIGSGPVDPPTLAGRAHPEQAFHRSAARVVVERSSTLVKAACMPRLTPPEALAVEVMAELMAESAEERAERGNLSPNCGPHPEADERRFWIVVPEQFYGRTAIADSQRAGSKYPDPWRANQVETRCSR